MNRDIIKLDYPAIQPALNISELHVKTYVSMVEGITKSMIVVRASEEAPFYRLAKDYEAGDQKFALLLLTTKKNLGKAEKFLDKCAESITKEKASEAKHIRGFQYLGVEYK